MSNAGSEQDFMQQLRVEFLDEVTFLIEQCEESYLKIENPEARAEELDKIFRMAHSIKGAGAAVGFADLAAFAHVVEDCLTLLRTFPALVDTQVVSLLLRTSDAFKDRIGSLRTASSEPWETEALVAEINALVASMKVRADFQPVDERAHVSGALPDAGSVSPHATSTHASGSSSIKIDTDRVESLLNLVGELVVVKSQLANQCAVYSHDLRLSALVALLERTVRELQDRTLSMRMTPLKTQFLKVQRIVRDLSIKLEKPVEFRMSGEETEIDRTMVELLSDPIMHIVRNSVDHGVESAQLRREKGKPEKGQITLSASQAGGRVLVRIQDDGGGINRKRVLAKAIEKGLIAPGRDPARMSDREICGLIFTPGFSTAEQLTEVSGRGVGMDVVKTNIEKLKGTVEVESKEGAGTCITLSIPLTTSVTDGMVVQYGGRTFVLPMENIRELLTVRRSDLIETYPGTFGVRYRERVIAKADLLALVRDVTFEKRSEHDECIHVVVESGGSIAAFEIDQIVGQTQVVLKALDKTFSSTRGVAGAAILGDGRVALVLDPSELLGRGGVH